MKVFKAFQRGQPDGILVAFVCFGLEWLEDLERLEVPLVVEKCVVVLVEEFTVADLEATKVS